MTGTFSDSLEFINEGEPLEFICGDINFDGAGPDISDLVYFIDWMFRDGPPPPVMVSADVNSSTGEPDISDLTYLINYMFLGGPAPACP
jgi:hypothetical protein